MRIYSSAVKPNRGRARKPDPAPSRTRKPMAVPAAARASGAKARTELQLGTFFLWLLLLVPPFLFASLVKESFRQPKLLASGFFALASVTALAWTLRRVETVRLADVWRLPAVRIVLPILAVATLGLAFTAHPIHAREALIDLWIGAAALVAWSAALPNARLEHLLGGLLWPATALALFGILQFHGLWQPLELIGLTVGSRLAITSLAGNPGDLGAYLVLPVLLAQDRLRRRLAGDPEARPGTFGTVVLGSVMVICLYALLLTQTLAAVAAVALGSLVLWIVQMPRRRAFLVLGGGAVAAALLVAAVSPLRERVLEKTRQATGGDWNGVLTGRLDGWRTAVWMLTEHPLTGVGHGAYRTEYVPAKLALLNQGVAFYPPLSNVGFANAHNEFLEAGADWGIPGLVALAWGLGVLFVALLRFPGNRALAWAGVLSLAVLSLADFPFRVALVAFPALLFLSWILQPPPVEEER